MKQTTESVVQLFLNRPRKASTQRFYENHLKLFLKGLKTLPVEQLKVHHLTSLVDQYKGNYAHNICRAVKTCFKWLADNEYIGRDPFSKVKAPPAIARGDEAYIEPKRWKNILDRIDGDLLDILTVIREAGCRPQEARILAAGHLQGQCCVLSKVDSKGGKVQRVIHLSDTAYAILRRFTLKYPEGPLLRNRGKPWTAQTLANRCKRFGFHPYQLRHTFCNEALMRGVDVLTVAALMGHADTKMVSLVYSHLKSQGEYLQAALKKAVG